MSCIKKDCEFESGHCHLEFGVSISISHLICVGLLRCSRTVRLAGAAPCSTLLYWGCWFREAESSFNSSGQSPSTAFTSHYCLSKLNDEFASEHRKVKRKQNNSPLHFILLCLSLSINLFQELLSVIFIVTDGWNYFADFQK